MSKTSARASTKAPNSFEDALSELETLVQAMESGQQPLEASLAAYERGLSLLRFCQEKLQTVEARVQVLEGESLVPLSAPTSDA